MSEETKRRLEQVARDLAEKKARYEEDRLKHQTELQRVQALRESKRKRRMEQKERASKMRQRRYGKWKLSENGWSSVAETELNPIEQSLVGSPVISKCRVHQ